MFPSELGARCIFLNIRGPDLGSNTFLFDGDRKHAPGRSELRRASRAGACNSIQDAGARASRAPAPTRDVFHFCKDFFEFWVLKFGHFLSISGDFRV